MLNAFLNGISFGHLGPCDWLGNTETALLSIIILSIWRGVRLKMIILLAGLQGIPASLYEAASIDKANRWQQFRNVTVPRLREHADLRRPGDRDLRVPAVRPGLHHPGGPRTPRPSCTRP